MKKIFTTLLLLSIVMGLSAQRMGDRNYNMGTCKKLNGSTCVITLFVTNGYTISQEEKDNYYNRLHDAERYLRSVSGTYGKSLSFANILLNGGNSYSYTCSKAMDKANPEDILYMAKGNDWKGYIDNLKSVYTNVLVITCMKLDATHTNFSYANNKTCANMVEGVVVNLNYRYKYAMCPIIAHEMLHCFGARDLYDLTGYKDHSYDQYDTKFSKSLMGTLNNEDPYKFEVDDATAYMVGLTDAYKPWFYNLYNDGIN